MNQLARNITAPTDPYILWIHSSPIIDNGDQNFKFHSLRARSYEHARWYLNQFDIAVIVIGSLSDQGSIDFFAEVHQKWPQMQVVWGFDSPHIPNLETIINRFHFSYLMGGGISSEHLLDTLNRAIRRNFEIKKSQQSLKQTHSENRRLEHDKQKFEERISSCTKALLQSKAESGYSIERLKKIVQFIRNLDHAAIIDELMLLMRTELRGFPRLCPPLLLYSINGKDKALFFRGRELQEISISRPWKVVPLIRQNDQDDRKYLVDQLHRPFLNVLVLALPVVATITEDQPGGDAPVLVIEHDLQIQQLSTVQSFLEDRKDLFALTLDRLIQEQMARLVSRQWEAVFDGIRNPIAIIEGNYEIIRTNKSFLGNKNDKKCYQRLFGADKPCVNCPLPQLASPINQISKNDDEVYFRSRIQVHQRHYQAHCYPLKIGNNTHLYFINYYDDITHEQELFLKLVNQEKMSALGRLSGHLAHALNNPLTGIRSLAQVLLASTATESQIHSDLTEVEQAAQRCQKIISNLLDFSSQNPSPDFNVVEFDEIIEKTLPLLKTSMRMYNVQVHCNAKVSVQIDAQLCQQVIFNLIHNACQATLSSGTLSITTRVTRSPTTEGMTKGRTKISPQISSSYDSDPSCFVEFRVEDSGPGVPEELKEAIFQPFFTTKSKKDGTGLGLSISRSIVEKFGGRLWVEDSTLGGAAFVFILPKYEGTKIFPASKAARRE